ncbi:piggyBac transposable element-derived protein 4-like [Temnothorax nylanderi]|uniref:piggyBac transposable element-derived protein 4-like n=1 Tax=Temnothorax nylanderi TaxID=102681 RepID=UPI003A8B4368
MDEELSRSEFARLNRTERDAYIKRLLGDASEESEINDSSDDEDWVPNKVTMNEPQSDAGIAGESSEGEGESDTEPEECESESEDTPAAATRENVTTSYVTKDNTVWLKTPPQVHQTLSHNILRQRSGPHKSTETLSVRDTFTKIITPEMVDLIIRHTNRKAEEVYNKYNAENPNSQRSWKAVTPQEFYAFSGILICSGVNNSNTDHTSEMWKTTSYPLYRAAMGYKRFRSILRFIRFDDPRTRQTRAETDKLAPIRDIWTILNSNLNKMYKPTANLTIDEQLYPYRSRTKFTQYIPSKPAKYGIKIWWICDAENAYPLQGIIYAGKSGDVREKNQGERVVKELAAPFKGSGRNITMDNYFTTLPLAKHLLSWKISIVGTLRRNKPYIPKQMAPHKSREEFSTLFGFHENVAICSYVPKKNKAVILLSTLHCDTAVSDNEKKKPDMIAFYNKYKCGVDTMDQMVSRYSTHRRTSRWPLALFFNILDLGSLASYIIYYENNKMISKKTNQRRLFLRQLSEELAKPFIEDRSANVQIMRHFSTKLAIDSIIGLQLRPSAIPLVQNQPRDSSGRKQITGLCHICYKETIKRRRKTRKCCAACEKPVCDEHCKTSVKCMDCI